MSGCTKSFLKSYLLCFLMVMFIAVLSVGNRAAYAAENSKNDYLIRINRACNTVTIYAKDETGAYNIPVKAMLCSVGKDNLTRPGVYKTSAKYRWKLLMNHVWGQYSTRINGGILFHSVYYYSKKPSALATKEFNKLGNAASHGCVRLSVADAKWIYDNCYVGSTVEIYDDSTSPGPLGKPGAIKIPSNMRWDPTDPDKRNPYTKKKPELIGVKNLTTEWNQSIDLRKGVKAKSSLGRNISSKVNVQGALDLKTPGVYNIRYSVTDELNKTVSKTAKITVKANKVAPVLTGITDKVIGPNQVIDREFALTGVDVYCAGSLQSKDNIQVVVTRIDDLSYQIAYQASVAFGPVIQQSATIRIDNQPPVISGIKQITLAPGEVPDGNVLTKDILLTDNYSPAAKISFQMSMIKNSEQAYQVTYTASDEFGNATVIQSILMIQTPPTNISITQVAGNRFLNKNLLFGTLFRQLSIYYNLKIYKI